LFWFFICFLFVCFAVRHRASLGEELYEFGRIERQCLVDQFRFQLNWAAHQHCIQNLKIGNKIGNIGITACRLTKYAKHRQSPTNPQLCLGLNKIFSCRDCLLVCLSLSYVLYRSMEKC
jgi:hypothetical protein